MISLQGNVDWFRFWLKGERRESVAIPKELVPDLAHQYERWDQMAKLGTGANVGPNCVREESGEE